MPPLKPDRDKNFGGSLVFDFGQWWRHVKTIRTVRTGCLLLINYVAVLFLESVVTLFSRPQIITVQTMRFQLIERLSGASTSFLTFCSWVYYGAWNIHEKKKAVGDWLNRGLVFHRENSDGHSAKLNNVGSQRSNGKMGHYGQFL